MATPSPNISAPLFAVLSPAGAAAIAVIAIWGEAALATLARTFRPLGTKQQTLPLKERVGTVLVGHWQSDLEGEAEEELVVALVAPDAAEISCHGGRSAVARITQSLAREGCVMVDPALYVARATSDALKLQAMERLTRAKTSLAAAHLLDQTRGALSSAVRDMIDSLERGDVAGARRQIKDLLTTARQAIHLTEPYRVTIVGRPNAGKSALLNQLVGYARAMVFDQPGTTRDVVQVTTALGGYAVEISDTAGVRETSEPIEREGIERTLASIATCDLALLVFDQSAPLTADDRAFLSQVLPRLTAALIVVGNKSDLPPQCSFEQLAAINTTIARAPSLSASALTGAGIRELLALLEKQLVPTPLAQGSPLLFSRELEQAFRKILAALDQSNDPRAIARQLAELLARS